MVRERRIVFTLIAVHSAYESANWSTRGNIIVAPLSSRHARQVLVYAEAICLGEKT